MVLDTVRIRQVFNKCLILLFFLLVSCSANKESHPVSIYWERDSPVGISIPLYFIPDASDQHLRVRLAGPEGQPDMLGTNERTDTAVIFRPLIPLTRGMRYDVLISDAVVATLQVPVLENVNAVSLINVYPSQDTLPENLLKVYLQFNQPMREGDALKHVLLLKNGTDTVRDVFLNLDPELWNNDQTMLTLWLDPGRIKRDLQPNVKMGTPLKEATLYTLLILNGWENTQGQITSMDYKKIFYVTARDSRSPDINRWKINLPEAGSKLPLKLLLNEPLDRVLLLEAVSIIDKNGNTIRGTVDLLDEEQTYVFTPDRPWEAGVYKLTCESRLEDLSGNNLNRLFDRDLKEKTAVKEQNAFTRQFQISQ